MITETGLRLVKLAEKLTIEQAMGFVTDRIRRPGLSLHTLHVPPTRKKKVDENGNILKPIAGHKNRNGFFGKFLDNWRPQSGLTR